MTTVISESISDTLSKTNKKLVRAQRKIQILEELIEDQARQIHENAAQLETVTESSCAWKVREGLLTDLIEHANEAIFAIDPQSGLLIEVNAAAATRLGYTKEELRNANIQDIELSLESSDNWNAFVHNIRVAGSNVSRESMHRCKDGSEFPVEIHTRLVEREGRSYLISVVRDITQRRINQAKLKDAQDALVEASRKAGMADVASSILHNVGNVLNSLTVNTIQLEDGLRKSELKTFIKARELIDKQSADLDSFIKTSPKVPKLLTLLARSTTSLEKQFDGYQVAVETIKNHLQHVQAVIDRQQKHAKAAGIIEEVHLEDLINDAIHIACNDYAPLGIVLELKYEKLEVTKVDKNKVLEILINLLSNARHAVLASDRTEKKIEIRLLAIGTDQARIAVLDNGIGLSAAILPRVFEQGFTTKDDGNGLGLHASANAAHQMGGCLTCHSGGPGCGATFSLVIPVNQEA